MHSEKLPVSGPDPRIGSNNILPSTSYLPSMAILGNATSTLMSKLVKSILKRKNK